MTCAGAAAKQGPRLFAYGSDMELDFTTGVLDTRVTASGGVNGYVVNAAGLLVPKATPRFDHDPVTLAAKGLLVEEARTNLLKVSGDSATSDFAFNALTRTGSATTAPDGTSDAIKATPTSANSAHQLNQSVTNSATTYTLSVYAKAAGYDFIKLGSLNTGSGVFFNLSAGTVGTADSGYAGTIVDAGDGWYRCTVTATLGAGTDYPGAYVCATGSATSFIGDTTSGVYLWGWQYEAGAFATSYIPTAGSTVTRTADVASMTGSNFNDWFNQTAGTLLVEFDSIGTDTGHGGVPVAIDDGTNDGYQIYRSQSSPVLTFYAGSAGSAALGSIALNTTQKAAFAYSAGEASAVLNGGTVRAVTPVALSTLSKLSLGRSGFGNQLSCHIRRILYFNRRLPNDDLQRFTI